MLANPLNDLQQFLSVFFCEDHSNFSFCRRLRINSRWYAVRSNVPRGARFFLADGLGATPAATACLLSTPPSELLREAA
jgi:hypothetical protein